MGDEFVPCLIMVLGELDQRINKCPSNSCRVVFDLLTRLIDGRMPYM